MDGKGETQVPEMREQARRPKYLIELYRVAYDVTFASYTCDAYEVGRLRMKLRGKELPFFFVWLYVCYLELRCRYST